MTDREKLIRDVVAFMLTHHETIEGRSSFAPEIVSAQEWWSKMDIMPLDTSDMTLAGAEHHNARIARWQDLVAEHFRE